MIAEFGTSGRVIFGKGEFRRVGELCAELGRRAFIVTGKSSLKASGALDQALEAMRIAGIACSTGIVSGEPTVGRVDALAEEARQFMADCVVAVGGGSVLDAGKAIAALATNADSGVSAIEFLEGVGTGRKVDRPPLPMLAAPTTAGTGSEVTRNAVIRADDRSFKKSMRDRKMRPTIALVDPALTMGSPQPVTAASGADAETQLIEGFVSMNAGPLTDGFAREGLRLTRWAIERVNLMPFDQVAHEAMSLASLLGGIVLDNAGLGAVHGLASPIGAMFDAPHGVICGNLLPDITEANIAEAKARSKTDDAAHDTLRRYAEVALCFQGDFACDPSELPETLRIKRDALKLPPLSSYGIREEHVPSIVAQCRGGSMRTNPFALSDDQLAGILRRAIRQN